jgi:hypothetical protein
MPTITELTEEAVDRSAIAAELNDGLITWQEAHPEAGGYETALEMAREDAARAWAELEAAERGSGE